MCSLLTGDASTAPYLASTLVSAWATCVNTLRVTILNGRRLYQCSRCPHSHPQRRLDGGTIQLHSLCCWLLDFRPAHIQRTMFEVLWLSYVHCFAIIC
uniref:Uncharacterized protein n=1 Tax=Anguilla anguilla TaxID=7936 RepID=A0A0E9WU49_ANGAN